jgi:5-methylcytosine-specific restriction endonuclease McrA
MMTSTSDISSITFTVSVHFSNGETVENTVSLKKALKLSEKRNVFVPDDTDYVELKGVNQSVIIPVNMFFVIQKAPHITKGKKVNRQSLYKKDGGICGYCGKQLAYEHATIDHVVPTSRGGESAWDNVVLACAKCNNKKANRTPKEARMEIKFNDRLG